ncbi:MAG: hypothetical protein ACOZNI_21770 [Myxococcota bacterium]
MDTITKGYSQPYAPRISIRAVAVGAVVALGINAILMELAGALGLWRFGVIDGAWVRDVGVELAIWSVLAWVVAVFAASAYTSRAADVPYGRDGAVHGIATWGVATLMAGVGCAMAMVAMWYTGFLTRDAFEAMGRDAMWVGFAADLLALVAGATGGLVGVRQPLTGPEVRYRTPADVTP